MIKLTDKQKLYLKKKGIKIRKNRISKFKLVEEFNFNGKTSPTISGLIKYAFSQLKKKTSYSFLWVEFLSIFRTDLIKTTTVDTGVWYLEQDKDPSITLPCDPTTENAIQAQSDFYTWVGPKKLYQVVGQNIFSANIYSAYSRLVHNREITSIKAEHCWFNACKIGRMRNDICFFNRDNQVILVVEYHEAIGPHATPKGTFLDECKKHLCLLADKPYFQKKETSTESFAEWFAPMYQALFQKLTASEPSLHNLYVVNKIRQTLKEYISAKQIMFLYQEIVKQELNKERKPDIPLQKFLKDFFSLDEESLDEYQQMILDELNELTYLENQYIKNDQQVLISYDLFMRITFMLGEMKDEFQKYLFTFEKLSRACLLLIRQELKETQLKKEHNLAYLQKIWEWGYAKGENSSLFSDSHRMMDILCQVIQTIRIKTPNDNQKAQLLKIMANFLQPNNRKLNMINQAQLLEKLKN